MKPLLWSFEIDLVCLDRILLLTHCENANPRQDTPSPNLFKPVKLEDSLDPTPVKQFRAWFDKCNARHERCSAIQQDSLLPTRVLDLDDMPSSDALAENMKQWPELFSQSKCKLVETTAGQKGKYATLSYCWGNGLPFMTTTETLSMRKSSIGFQDLPKTLQDAAMVVRFLGLRYVWIDCLAIGMNRLLCIQYIC